MARRHAEIFSNLNSEFVGNDIDLQLRSLPSAFLRALYLACLGIPDNAFALDLDDEVQYRNEAIDLVTFLHPRLLSPHLAQHVLLILAQRAFV